LLGSVAGQRYQRIRSERPLWGRLAFWQSPCDVAFLGRPQQSRIRSFRYQPGAVLQERSDSFRNVLRVDCVVFPVFILSGVGSRTSEL
jgi:hypothetical protein